MSGIVQTALRCLVARSTKSALRPLASTATHHRFRSSPVARTLPVRTFHTKGLLGKNPNTTSPHLATTQGEKELAEFLVDEIAAEKKLQKTKNIPLELDGFSAKLDGSQVIFQKTTPTESIEIIFNINHSVDSEHQNDVEQGVGDRAGAEEVPPGEMKSRPTFDVALKRSGKTLSFTCSMVSPTEVQPSESGYTDLFTIDEVSLYEGDWKDNKYAVSGEVLDGTLYDLFMNLLEDKGISNDFVEKISDFSTAYEHSCYINFLEEVKKFAQGN